MEEMKKNTIIKEYESEIKSMYKKNTCFLGHFYLYCKVHFEKEKEFDDFYCNEKFRQDRFFVYCKKKSSEMLFFNKIKETFATPSINEKKSKYISEKMRINALRCIVPENNKPLHEEKNIVIAYGNGGKGMNKLKGLPSVPNINIRRRMGQHFIVFDQNEHFSSKTCPCCNNRSMKVQSFCKDGKHYRKHHLLRCTNECESKWWNRDVSASLNILKWFLDENPVLISQFQTTEINEGR